MIVLEHTRLIPFRENDLAPLVNFWNNSFVNRRNFYSISATDFQNRILHCEAFDPNGLILAWHDGPDTPSQVVGMVHAFRPAPRTGLYAKWEGRHNLALLYVDPAYRRRGIGSRLLRAAENWLYYCPVHVGGPAQPCYGTIEGLRPPFFGSTQRMGVSVHDTLLTSFLARRGYRIDNPGDISMELTLTPHREPALPELEALRLVAFSHEMPFAGREPVGREEYTLYGDNGYSRNYGAPYYGYAFVTDEQLLQAHISWYPMHQVSKAAIAGFWVAPSLRRRGFGGYLLDRVLADLFAASFLNVEVQTHLVNHAQAVGIYEKRGFEVVDAWVNMSKECSVRTPIDVGLSAY